MEFQLSNTFLRIAAVAALLTVVTTLLVHLLFTTPSAFEDQVSLYRNSLYLTRIWITIFHCLLVLLSMTAMGLILFTTSPALSVFGIFGFLIFVLMEWMRMFSVLFELNALREAYQLAQDEQVKDLLRFELDTWRYKGTVLFNIFFLAFAAGCLCFGPALLNHNRFLGWMFIAWGVMNMIAFLNEQWQFAALDRFMETFSITFQPFVRLLAGIWLWQQSKLVNRKVQTVRDHVSTPGFVTR
jgi:hypothetical protein